MTHTNQQHSAPPVQPGTETQAQPIHSLADIALKALVCSVGCPRKTFAACSHILGQNCECDCHRAWAAIDAAVDVERTALAAATAERTPTPGTPSAQFDWYWRSNPSNFEQVTTLDGQMILAWHAWCAALYLNGLAADRQRIANQRGVEAEQETLNCLVAKHAIELREAVEAEREHSTKLVFGLTWEKGKKNASYIAGFRDAKDAALEAIRSQPRPKVKEGA